MPPTRKNRRRWRLRLALLAVGFLVALVVAEGAIRVMGLAPKIDPHMGWLTTDPNLPYKPKPHSHIRGEVPTGEYSYDHRHNSAGFRDIEHTVDKPAGTFRILGVGDSFTAGWGAPYEETYLRRLERALAARTGKHPHVEVIKAGINGYFPESENLVVEHFGLQFSPDLIVVGFLPNDVIDTVRGIDAVTVDKQGFLTSAEAAELGATGTWLYRASHLARIGLQAWVSNSQRNRPANWWMPVFKPNAEFEAAWQEVERQYDRMVGLANTAGAHLVVLHIPESVPREDYQNYPPERLATWCKKRGATFIDAGPHIRAAADAREEPLYYPVDRHCTPAGYAAIADALLAGLLAAKLVP